MPPQQPGHGGIGEQALIRATQDLVIAVNGLRTLISTLFVSSTASLSTSATAGAASALPGNPEKYVLVNVNGVPYKAALWKP